jgi:hypothetical protein
MKMGKSKITLLIIVVSMSILLFLMIKPIIGFITFNTDHLFWLDKKYDDVKNFNVIDFTSAEDKEKGNYTYRKCGESVQKNSRLFSKKTLIYLPKTNIWITGVYGVENSAAYIGIVDCNKYSNYTSPDGEVFTYNHLFGDGNGKQYDTIHLHDFAIVEINQNNLKEGKLHLGVFSPDMSVYDEVTIKVNLSSIK